MFKNFCNILSFLFLKNCFFVIQGNKKAYSSSSSTTKCFALYKESVFKKALEKIFKMQN